MVIKQKKVSEQIIEELRQMIRSGKLKDGDKLPNQIEFAAQLGVSRNSLREALNTLVMLGAVEQRPRTGTIVKASSLISIANQITIPVVEDSQTTLEFIQSRRFVEMGTVELAIENGTPDEIALLERQLLSMDKAIRENDAVLYVETDLKFHIQIARASHNRFMLNQFMTYHSYISQFMQAVAAVPNIVQRSNQEHQRIYKGIRDKDMEQAVSAMKEHILKMEDPIRDLSPDFFTKMKTANAAG
ncbi:MAG: FadR family transcriptional regulator [Deltaproteobacteria bacterium]|jgi:GntR family transcriptional regulator, transcriptional repressor for pyruvate dehydrogenase complex|nr:FadR family transcriptional regulator [Deltaproteobacteria bacterium]MBT4266841.1 FadR family transcriptional regulator [Deltaproteobacteria bacterium]MBT4640844.1 FadR family transcriptional regulator [Deltaproteobacteria bacterium]MBT6502365.1 FadR family transcriptional regulator [Deltaproteobacteria bacterium]MBT6611208.1 FadR family transcriptional regulator [Deltaproteobacteria bacterium]